MKKLLIAVLTLAIVAPTIVLPAPARAADEEHPNIQVFMVDDGGDHPDFPYECENPTDGRQRFGWGSTVTDNIGNDNADCAKIRITNPSSRYTEDFRFCLSLGGDGGQDCTPWASEGGGGARQLKSYQDWAIGYMSVWTETRALQSGGYIENAEVGIQWFQLNDNSSNCAASAGAKFTSGGDNGSDWTYGGAGDNDPGCAQIFLRATQVAPYDAAFAGSNLSGAVLDANRAYPAGANYRITMRNTAHTWTSDTTVRQIGDCDDYEAGADTAPCSYVKVISSPNIKLALTDPDTFAFSQTEFPYERMITVTHRSQQITRCTFGPVTPGGPTPAPILSRLFGVPTANAQVIPINPGDGNNPEPPDPICIQTPDWAEIISESPARSVIAPSTADFPLSFTTPGPGSYELGFKLRKTDGAAPGTDANGFFGPDVVIPVTIRDSGTAGIGMSCPVAELTVQQGETASYAVTLASQGGFAGPVTITPTGMPTGATSPGATATLAANASTTSIIPIFTTPATPAGTSQITFTAATTVAGVQSVTCTSQLTVRGQEQPTFDVRPARATVQVRSTVQYRAYYDADGAGILGEQDVTDASVWSVSANANSQGGGVMLGVAQGSANVRASYAGSAGSMTDSALLTVTANLQSASLAANLSLSTSGGNWQPSLSGQPPLSGVDLKGNVGGSGSGDVTYTFYCNRADAGTDVTSGYARQFTGGSTERVETDACSYGQVGTYTPKLIVSRGEERAESRATVSVTALPTTSACTFTAAPGTLFIPPLRATTLSWQCQEPTSCTVTNVTGGGTVVTTGAQAGSGQDRPSNTTTYRLSCDNGVRQDLSVRVFDVTTRIEILPR